MSSASSGEVATTPGSFRSSYYNVSDDDVMPVCIRGVEIKVNAHRVAEYPGTRLHELVKAWRVRCETRNDRRPVYVDRNPIIFHCVLDYYVTGELHLPDALCSGQVKGELEYWGIGADTIAPCCLWKTRDVWDTTDKLAQIMHGYDQQDVLRLEANTWREKAWSHYSQPFSSRTGMAMYVFLSCIYALFLSSLLLQSMPAHRDVIRPRAVNSSSPESLLQLYGRTEMALWLRVWDFALLAVITAFLGGWFLICPDKRMYVTAVVLVGALGLLVQWLPVTVNAFSAPRPAWYTGSMYMYIQGLKVLRILPVFGLLSPLRSMRILVRALVESRRELGLLLILVAMSSTLFGYLIFAFEIGMVGTHFKSISDGCWWGLVTLTTVGYGDMFPQTSAGRMVGVACAVVGILVVALPVPIISCNFTKIYELEGVAEYHRTLKKNAARKHTNRRSSVSDAEPDDIT